MRPPYWIALASSIALGAGLLPGAARGQATAAPATPQLWQPQAVNLAMASGEPAVGRRTIAFVVPENGHGYGDLNGDGDAQDDVLHLGDPLWGTSVNLGLAGVRPEAGERLVVFAVSEADQGYTDLNGDGDTADGVLHVLDTATGRLTSTALATSLWPSDFIIEGARVAFVVHEFQQGGLDLNGDGDASDAVLFVYDAAADVALNLGLASRGTGHFLLSGSRMAFLVDEADQGNLDLNGDGDTWDAVLHLRDLSGGSTLNVGIAPHSPSPQFVLDGADVAVMVRETAQGMADLNGDGDWLDEVLHLVDFASGSASNLALAGARMHLDAGVLVFQVIESGQGQSDLNGDGDATDNVYHTYRMAPGLLANLQLAGAQLSAHLHDGLLAFLVIEKHQGNTDLNGDGDVDDWVLHTHEVWSGATANHALACSHAVRVSWGRAFVEVSEDAQGQTDLNGDGDASDGVLHSVLAATGAVNNLGLASSGSTFIKEVAGPWVAFRVRESSQGYTDLNGDGDTLDYVLHLHCAPTGLTTNLALSSDAPKLRGGLATFLVSEIAQGGADLNGDGDAIDLVVHVAR